MRKLINYILVLPLAILLIVISVANRQTTQFSLDPMNSEAPALAIQLPFFVFLFVAMLIGVLIGGTAVWWTQGKHRRALREKSHEADQLKKQQTDNQSKGKEAPAEIAPGLPLVTQQSS